MEIRVYLREIVSDMRKTVNRQTNQSLVTYVPAKDR